MISVNGTEALAFGMKSEHLLVRKGSFVNQRVARKPSSISLMFASNVDPNTLDDTVQNDSSPSRTPRRGDDGNAECPDFDTEERIAFSEHLNNVLKDDKTLSRYIPLDPFSDDMYTKLDDGVILCKLINFAVPGTIDERAINKKANLNVFQKTENLNLALGAASNIGCRLVNVGAQDIISGRRRLILGVVWQIIKIQLMSKISFKNVPNLAYLLESGEDKAVLAKLSGESILLRWVNFHLKRTQLRVSNFSSDLSDCVVYNALLKRLDPSFQRLQVDNLFNVAQHIIDFVTHEFDIAAFISPQDIISGNAKLNMGFLAQIFAYKPNLSDTSEVDEEYVTDQRVAVGSKNSVNFRDSLGSTSFNSEALPSPSTATSSPSNSHCAKSLSTLSSSPSANRPKSSAYLLAGSPRNTVGQQSRFFGSAEGDIISASTPSASDANVQIPANIVALVARSPTASTPLQSTSSEIVAAENIVPLKLSPFLVTSATPTLTPDVRIPANIQALVSNNSTPHSSPRNVGAERQDEMDAGAAQSQIVSIQPTSVSGIASPGSLTITSTSVSERRRAQNQGVPRLELVVRTDVDQTNEDATEAFEGLCDYQVADDLSTLDGTESVRDEAPRRTFTDGYFGHNNTHKNFTDSNDFEIDEDMALLRWVNTQLERANCKRRISNFTYDLSDSYVYATLLQFMAPEVCPVFDRSAGILVKAELVVECAAALGLGTTLTAADICNCSMTKNRAFVVELIVYQRTQNILARQRANQQLSSQSSPASSTVHPTSLNMDHNATFSNLRIGSSQSSATHVSKEYSTPSSGPGLMQGFVFQQSASPHHTPGLKDGDESTLSSLGDYNGGQFVISEEAILLWANKLLRRCGYHGMIRSFDDDLSSCEIYGLLLHALDPVNCKLPDLDKDPYLRACTVLDNAAFLNVVTFIEPTDLITHSPAVTKLFLTNLYEDVRDSDENTVMRWLNYQLYKAGVPRVVENLGSDLQDLVVYSSLLHFIANSPKPESDRLMSADEIIKRINYICPLDFHVTPNDLLCGDVHSNVEMLSKLCSRLAVVSQNRSSQSLRQSLIPTKRTTMKARMVGSPSSGGMALAPPVSSGRPPASPFSRKAPALSGLAGKGVSHVRTPRTDADNSSMCSIDSHDTLKRPLGRWPECLQNNESKSPHQRKLAPPRDLAKTKSFLERTKSQQDVLLKLEPSSSGEVLGLAVDINTSTGRFLQSTASQAGVPPRSNVVRSGSPHRSATPTVAVPVGAVVASSAVAQSSGDPTSSNIGTIKVEVPLHVGNSDATGSQQIAQLHFASSTPRKLATTQSASILTKKPSFLSPTQSSSAAAYKASSPDGRTRPPQPSTSSSSSSSLATPHDKGAKPLHRSQSFGTSTVSSTKAATPSRGAVTEGSAAASTTSPAPPTSETKLLRKTSSFMKSTPSTATPPRWS